MKAKYQRALIPVSKRVLYTNPNIIHISGKYYIWFWKIYNTEVSKRRKANKLARKQRKINNRNR